MEVHVRLRSDKVNHLEIIESLVSLDPSAVADYSEEESCLRISTVLTYSEVLHALKVSGLGPASYDISIVPSVCCGGCSG